MGFEYNFIITKKDINNLSRNRDGIDDLDKLFRSAPYFIKYSDSTYYYNQKNDEADTWPSNISIQDYGFCLCIYDRNSDAKDLELVNYLIHELLHRCDRVEIENQY